MWREPWGGPYPYLSFAKKKSAGKTAAVLKDAGKHFASADTTILLSQLKAGILPRRPFSAENSA
jgi:hypothetical protein